MASSWSAADFANGALKLVQVVQQDQSPEGLLWSYEKGCLVAVTSRHESPSSRYSGSDILATTCERITAGLDWEECRDLEVDESILSDGDAVVAVNKPRNCDLTEWRFSVAYSDVWLVPVLYFTVQRITDGAPCTRQEVLDMLHLYNHQNFATAGLDDSSWDFCSYDEHPVSGMPSFFLHPCRTLERLEALKASVQCPSVRLWSWFSMILPTVGLSVSPKCFQRVQRKLEEEEQNNEK